MPADRTLLSRHECKYFVPPTMLPAIRVLMRPFVRPDEYARKSPGYRYRLSSLYLDTPEYALYRQTIEGHRNRFKLRMRTYDDDPRTPIFCEIKKRAERVVRKVRVGIERPLAEDIVRGTASRVAEDPRLGEFLLQVEAYNAGPALRVRYEREAYESTGDDPVRITFDTQLHFALPESSAPFRVGGGGWHPTPVEGAIVEIKFTDRCPSWVTRIVDELDLIRESIPKYVLCLDRAFDLGLLRGNSPRSGLRPIGSRIAESPAPRTGREPA